MFSGSPVRSPLPSGGHTMFLASGTRETSGVSSSTWASGDPWSLWRGRLLTAVWGFLNTAAFDGDLFVHQDNLLLETGAKRLAGWRCEAGAHAVYPTHVSLCSHLPYIRPGSETGADGQPILRTAWISPVVTLQHVAMHLFLSQLCWFCALLSPPRLCFAATPSCVAFATLTAPCNRGASCGI